VEQTTQQPQEKKPRGFAALSKEARTAIAKRGGDSVSKNTEHMASIGRKGGSASASKKKTK
jgi:general stress protein YciG